MPGLGGVCPTYTLYPRSSCRTPHPLCLANTPRRNARNSPPCPPQNQAPTVKLALEGSPAPGELPGAMVAPAADATAVWLLDAAAAAELGGGR